MARILSYENRAPRISEKVELNPEAAGTPAAVAVLDEYGRVRETVEKNQRRANREQRWDSFVEAVNRGNGDRA